MRLVIFDDPILAIPGYPVKQVTSATRQLAEDMIDTMYENDGVGLAAPQVGISQRIFVYDLNDGAGPQVVINPLVRDRSGEQAGVEGCLSVPDHYYGINRAESLTLLGTNLDGEQFSARFEGFGARVIQHEFDHLCGVLIINRLNNAQMDDFLRNWCN